MAAALHRGSPVAGPSATMLMAGGHRKPMQLPSPIRRRRKPHKRIPRPLSAPATPRPAVLPSPEAKNAAVEQDTTTTADKSQPSRSDSPTPYGTRLDLRLLLQKAFSTSNKLPKDPDRFFCHDQEIEQAYVNVLDSLK